MGSLEQLINKYHWKKKTHRWSRRLYQNPQKKGIVIRLRITTPRKPNSARRPTAKIYLCIKKRLTAHIPGRGHTLRRYSTVLVRGGGARDLPGIYYTCIRGVFDLMGLVNKRRRRSIYAAPQPAKPKDQTFIRRRLRKYVQ